MKERIYQIMQSENLTQREFAQALGISASSLSSIFNGHTSPTNYTVQAIHKKFPLINVAWLMFGEGDMFAQSAQADPAQGGATLEPSVEPAQSPTNDADRQQSLPAAAGTPEQVIIRETVKYIDKPQRKITEIHVFYDDGTFETFSGRRD